MTGPSIGGRARSTSWPPAIAVLRLLPLSNREKDVEILALRHQLTVLKRQLGKERVRFDRSDRARLAALLHGLPSDVLRGVRLLVRPDTVLGWHRNLPARRHAASSWSKRPGRPRTVRSVRVLALRLARENPSWAIGAGGTVGWSRGIGPIRGGPAGRGSARTSATCSFAWRGRTRRGDIDESKANSSGSARRTPKTGPNGRSSLLIFELATTLDAPTTAAFAPLNV
jgi:hypothetical protein